MRTITNVADVKLKVTKADLLYDKWIPFEQLSKKVAEEEAKEGSVYKSLRNRLYNALRCDKLNTAVFAGITCIDVDKPMKATASLKINFIKE